MKTIILYIGGGRECHRDRPCAHLITVKATRCCRGSLVVVPLPICRGLHSQTGGGYYRAYPSMRSGADTGVSQQGLSQYMADNVNARN